MQGIIRYLWYTNRKNIGMKVLIQLLILIGGYLTIFLIDFLQAEDNELYMRINILFSILMLLLSFDVYIQCYESIKRTKFDRYISATTIGLKRFHYSLIFFDFIFLLYSYVLSNLFLFQTYMMNKKINVKYEFQLLAMIFFLLVIIKLICIVTTILIQNTKTAMIAVLFIDIIFMKSFIDEKTIRYISYYIVFACQIIIFLVIIAILMQNKLIKLWKEDF